MLLSYIISNDYFQYLCLTWNDETFGSPVPCSSPIRVPIDHVFKDRHMQAVPLPRAPGGAVVAPRVVVVLACTGTEVTVTVTVTVSVVNDTQVTTQVRVRSVKLLERRETVVVHCSVVQSSSCLKLFILLFNFHTSWSSIVMLYKDCTSCQI